MYEFRIKTKMRYYHACLFTFFFHFFYFIFRWIKNILNNMIFICWIEFKNKYHVCIGVELVLWFLFVHNQFSIHKIQTFRIFIRFNILTEEKCLIWMWENIACPTLQRIGVYGNWKCFVLNLLKAHNPHTF